MSERAGTHTHCPSSPDGFSPPKTKSTDRVNVLSG
jgi:hypothetical protein